MTGASPGSKASAPLLPHPLKSLRPEPKAKLPTDYLGCQSPEQAPLVRRPWPPALRAPLEGTVKTGAAGASLRPIQLDCAPHPESRPVALQHGTSQRSIQPAGGPDCPGHFRTGARVFPARPLPWPAQRCATCGLAIPEAEADLRRARSPRSTACAAVRSRATAADARFDRRAQWLLTPHMAESRLCGQWGGAIPALAGRHTEPHCLGHPLPGADALKRSGSCNAGAPAVRMKSGPKSGRPPRSLVTSSASSVPEVGAGPVAHQLMIGSLLVKRLAVPKGRGRLRKLLCGLIGPIAAFAGPRRPGPGRSMPPARRPPDGT